MDLKLNKYLIAAALMVGTSQANATAYTFTDLGAGYANGINNSGQVVGYSYTHNSYPTIHATEWSGGTVTDLGTLGGDYNYNSNAKAINNSGQVAGWSDITYGNQHAVEWNNGTITDLGSLGGNFASANGINNAGQVVGEANTPTSSGIYYDVLWNNGTVTKAGGAGGDHLSGINDLGQAVGTSSGQAIMWSNGVMTNLGSLGAPLDVRAINNTGQAVGYSNFGTLSPQHATEWINGKAIDLGGVDIGGLGAVVYSYANSINNLGQIVGGSSTGYGAPFINSHATLWNNSKIIDLNSLLDATTLSEGWMLWQASGINDKGQIVGGAYNTITNAADVFLLTEVAAVPVPSAIWLFGSALIGLVGFNRRKSA